jgi:hypothetical protein
VNINLHIERLVLDGLKIGPGQGAIIKAAVEAELSRLLTEGGLTLQSGTATPNIKADSIMLNDDDNPLMLGQRIASSVYRGIGNIK